MVLYPTQLTTPSDTVYQVNEVAESYKVRCRLNPMLLYTEKVNLFYRKNLVDPLQTLNELGAWFNGITQPTERQVRQAMILTIDEDYSLKAGGGTISDRLFSSSLKWLQAHPKTGEDWEPVLIKKHSTDFTDVLITYADIRFLVEQTLTPDQKKSQQHETLESVVLTIYRGCLTGTFPLTAKSGVQNVPFDQSHLSMLLDRYIDTPDRLKQAKMATHRFRADRQRIVDQMAVPGQGIGAKHDCRVVDSLATRRFVAEQFRLLRLWDTVEKLLHSREWCVLPKALGVAPQLSLF